MSTVKRTSKRKAENNKMLPEDRPAHDWYRFVLSYPPHIVRQYLQKFEIKSDQLVLDPFCGTGTTVVECQKNGIRSLGVEANPAAHFACRVKLDWSLNPKSLLAVAEEISRVTRSSFTAEGIGDGELPLFDKNTNSLRDFSDLKLSGLSPDCEKLLLSESMSPLPLHKTLRLLENIREIAHPRHRDHLLLAAMKAVIFSTSNLHFGPEVGVTRKKKTDADVLGSWMTEVNTIARDLGGLKKLPNARSQVIHADARNIADVIEPQSISAVITSPPYPNEKDYTRTTRLESVLLGFLTDKQELRSLKKTLIRSNTRGVYKDDTDDQWVADHTEIQAIANRIEARRIELGKTSGFERTYARATRLYFGGMARHLDQLKHGLKPGAMLAYVVGDQASYLRVMIRTGELLADIAEGLGYQKVGIDLFRTRLATATKEQLREEVVILRWPG